MTTTILLLPRLLLLLISIIIVILTTDETTSIMSLTTVNALSTSNNPKPVAVLGGTGQLGQQTVRQLINQNIPVKCLVRPESKNLPKEWENEPLVEIVRGELLLLDNNTNSPTIGIENAEPSLELIECLKGCNKCIAVYGSTRRTKISDFFNKQIIEDNDPIHAKQINYRSIQGLLKACTASASASASESGGCKHIIRITGKGT
jgi:nucleoside-diphosphate-sugar epimerase